MHQPSSALHASPTTTSRSGWPVADHGIVLGHHALRLHRVPFLCRSLTTRRTVGGRKRNVVSSGVDEMHLISVIGVGGTGVVIGTRSAVSRRGDPADRRIRVIEGDRRIVECEGVAILVRAPFQRTAALIDRMDVRMDGDCIAILFHFDCHDTVSYVAGFPLKSMPAPGDFRTAGRPV
jgi:hypothetical protein